MLPSLPSWGSKSKPADEVEEDEEDLDKPPQFPLPGSAQRSAPAPSSEPATPPAPALELAPPSPERERSASPPTDLNIAILPDPIPLGDMAPPPSTTSRPAFGMKAGGGLGPPASAVTQNGGLGVPAVKPSVVKKEKKGRGKVALGPGCSALDWARLTQSGENLRGVEGGLIRVTKEELAKHKSRDDAWSAFNGAVYNITPYIRFHPGGEDELMRVAGRDGTRLFSKSIGPVLELTDSADTLVGQPRAPDGGVHDRHACAWIDRRRRSLYTVTIPYNAHMYAFCLVARRLLRLAMGEGVVQTRKTPPR